MESSDQPAAKPALLLHLTLTAQRGGCERDCELFIRHAPDLRHIVATFDIDGPMEAAWASAGAEVRHWPILGPWGPGFFREVRRRIRETGARHAIIWAPIRASLILGAMRGQVHSVLVHAGNPLRRLPVRDLARHLIGRLLGQPPRTIIVCCSDWVAESYQAHPNLGRFACFSQVNPVEIPARPPLPARVLDRQSEPRLGMVARLDRIKDHATVLRAFALIRREYPRARLQLAGDGTLRRRLESLARELELGDGVEFLGTVQDVDGVLRGWDLFLYATTPMEGLGNALAEAMASGLPCVVSDLPVTRELAGPNRAVRFVPAGDPPGMAAAAISLLGDAAARREYGTAARQRIAARFDPRRVNAFHRLLLGI